MRTDAIAFEEERLKFVSNVEEYPCLHERHRIFPAIFDGKSHRKVLDIAAGVRVVGKRIKDGCDAEVHYLLSVSVKGVKCLVRAWRKLFYEDGIFEGLLNCQVKERGVSQW